MRLTKRFVNFIGFQTATVYFEVFNLFNNKILNYDYVFATPDAMSVSTVTQKYEQYGIDDPNGIRWWNTTSALNPTFKVDQSFLIYSNSPRSYNFGISIEL